MTTKSTLSIQITDETFLVSEDAAHLTDPALQTASTEPDSDKDAWLEPVLSGEVAPQEAVGLAGFIAFAGIAYETYQKMNGFMSYVDGLLSGPDTPGVNVIDYDQANYALLQEVENGLTALSNEVSEISEALGEVANQQDLELLAEIRTGTFSLMDAIRGNSLPTQDDLNNFVGSPDGGGGEGVMNLALENIGLIADDASLEVIVGEIAPTLMAATAARIASAGYASALGLGEADVQNDIRAARTMLDEMFAPSSRLTQLMRNEVQHETFMVGGMNGNHVYEFLVVHTFTGPSGERAHLVAGDSSWQFGEAAGDNYPAHYVRQGSINGVSVADGVAATAAEIQGLSLDYVASYHKEHEIERDDVMAWLLGQASATITEVALREVDAIGGAEVRNFIDGLPSTAGLNEGDAGGNGADHIVGFEGGEGIFLPSPDLLMGGGGDDTLEGLGGRDALHGQSGFDVLHGGNGADKLYGGAHDDRLFGDDGNDRMQGDSGRDTLKGGEGDDVLYQGARGDGVDVDNAGEFEQNAEDGGELDGGAGHDLLVGDHGDDRLVGGYGHDTILGFGAADDIEGDSGNDVIAAGGGDDQIDGGQGDDTIEGGAGDDTIDGGFGDDSLHGGGGDDEFIGGYGVDTVIFRGDFHGQINGDGVSNLQAKGIYEESDFSITRTADGDWLVTDLRADAREGTDLIRGASQGAETDGSGVEFLRFDNVTIELEPEVIDPGFQATPLGPSVNPDFEGAIDELTYDQKDPGLWTQTVDTDADSTLVYGASLL